MEGGKQMSGFLDKLKNGFAEAGNKAKIMVDVNLLKLQMGQEEHEIREIFESMGEKVFHLYQTGDVSSIREQIEGECQRVIQKMEEIHRLELRVIELNDEKECPNCKQTLQKEVRFCPECGYAFEEEKMKEEEHEETGEEI